MLSLFDRYSKQLSQYSLFFCQRTFCVQNPFHKQARKGQVSPIGLDLRLHLEEQFFFRHIYTTYSGDSLYKSMYREHRKNIPSCNPSKEEDSISIYPPSFEYCVKFAVDNSSYREEKEHLIRIPVFTQHGSPLFQSDDSFWMCKCNCMILLSVSQQCYAQVVSCCDCRFNDC